MRVLLASDGSSDSRRATQWLRDLPLPSDTSLSVLTVATLTEPPRDSQTMSELRESLVREARRTSERAAAVLRRRWPEVETVVMQGDPRVEIVHVAEEARMDMIAVGARGLGRLRRLLVGSTSLAVARYAPCPVAIVKGEVRRLGRVLVAVDGSEGARTALRFLSSFELVREAQVILLHALPKSAAPGRGKSKKSASEDRVEVDRRKQRADADRLLADATAALPDAGRPMERVVAEGDPAREIVRYAHDHDVDLVVLGARGLRTLGRLLLGSVSETVLHHVARPALIVRER